MNLKRPQILTLLLLVLFAPPAIAQAHVKWFSKFSFGVPPRTLDQILATGHWTRVAEHGSDRHSGCR